MVTLKGKDAKKFEVNQLRATPLELKNKLLKILEDYIKPIDYNLSCKGCRIGLVEQLVKVAYSHFKL